METKMAETETYEVRISTLGCKQSAVSINEGEFALPGRVEQDNLDKIYKFHAKIGKSQVEIGFFEEPKWPGSEADPDDLALVLSLEVPTGTKAIDVSIDKNGDRDSAVGIFSPSSGDSVVAGAGRPSRTGNLTLVR